MICEEVEAGWKEDLDCGAGAGGAIVREVEWSCLTATRIGQGRTETA